MGLQTWLDRLPGQDNILATSQGDRDTVVRVAKLFTLSFMAFEGTWRFQAGRMGVQNFQKSVLGRRGLKADRLTFQETESLNFPLTPGSLEDAGRGESVSSLWSCVS